MAFVHASVFFAPQLWVSSGLQRSVVVPNTYSVIAQTKALFFYISVFFHSACLRVFSNTHHHRILLLYFICQ